jgi:phage tail sheath gpL-like
MKGKNMATKPFTVDDMSEIAASRIPGVNIGYDVRGALSGLGVGDRVCCFVGQLAAGSTAPINTVIELTTVSQAVALFGEDSNIVHQYRAAFDVFRSGRYCAIAMAQNSASPSIEPNFEEMFNALRHSTVHILSYPYEVTDLSVNASDVPISPSSFYLDKFLEEMGGPVEQRPLIAVSSYIGNIFGGTTPAYPNINNLRIAYANAIDVTGDNQEERVCGALSAAILRSPHPARPINGANLRLRGTQFYTREEINALLRNGVTPLTVNAARQIEVVRLISTETDGVSAQLPDMWVRSLDYIREAILAEIRHCFDGELLTEDSIGTVRSVIIGGLKKLEAEEVVKNVGDYIDSVIVEANPKKLGFLSVAIPVDIVIGMHGADGLIQMIVS